MTYEHYSYYLIGYQNPNVLGYGETSRCAKVGEYGENTVVSVEGGLIDEHMWECGVVKGDLL